MYRQQILVMPINAVGFNNLNVKNPINSKGGMKCTECTNCKDMICRKKKRHVSSIFEANTCGFYNKLSFASFLKSKELQP